MAVSRGRLGPVTVPQLVALQVAGLTVAAAYPLSDWVFVPTVLAAAGVAAAGFGRRNGRWWYQDAARRWSLHRRRRRAARASARPDPPLAALAPSLSVGTVTASRLRFGLGLDHAGWYVACAVWASDGDPAGWLSLDRLEACLATIRPPISTLQVVHHTPDPAAHPLAPEQAWVALRLGIADAPDATATRGGGADGVHRTLAAAVGMVGKVLRVAGLEHRVLARDELVAAVATVAGWDPTGPSRAGAVPVERWSAWYGMDAAHICFRLDRTHPRLLHDLSAWLRRSSARAYTVSTLVPLAGTGATPRLLQVAAPPDQLDTTTSEVTQLARQLGITIRRLDGEHGPALYATAPTAGAVPG